MTLFICVEEKCKRIKNKIYLARAAGAAAIKAAQIKYTFIVMVLNVIFMARYLHTCSFTFSVKVTI